MANPSQLALLKEAAYKWNSWREAHSSEHVDLSGADLSDRYLGGANLERADLSEAKLIGAYLWGAKMSRATLQGADMSRAKLRGVDLSFAKLSGANLSAADLQRANMRGAILRYVDLIGADLSEADLSEADLNDAVLNQTELTNANLSYAKLRGANLNGTNLSEVDLRGADLKGANLLGANLTAADLSGANLRSAALIEAHLSRASLSGAALHSANLSGANLSGANLSNAALIEAHLSRTNLSGATLHSANLSNADLSSADLSEATLAGADLTESDLRSANLQYAQLKEATLTGIMLWESQRAAWLIKGVVCEHAYWDKEAKEQTTYEPEEFERLHSDHACIELFYQGGVSKFELNTLPALLHHLAILHPDANVRLKSIEETGGGAKISISVGDSDAETVEKIRGDAMQVYQAQLALRDNEILRLETEKKYLESFVSERLIKAMLAATTQQNVFNAPVYGVALSSGNSSAVVNQTVNDNAGLFALLEKIIERRDELPLEPADVDQLHAEVDAAKAELAKSEPNPSILSRSLKFVEEMASEAIKKAAGKLGEQAVSRDWFSILHQLNQFVRHLK
jgi:uncharacterized protein YjbI with pentapeptide repeats